MSAKLLVNPIEIQNRLYEKFGVRKEQLIKVIQAGVSGRNECTAHHPSSMPGIRCWGEATRALRDLMVPLGWKSDNTDNIASVVHKKLRIKLAVTNADTGTGIEWGHPQPVREKGDGAQRAVFPNQTVLSILDDGLNGGHTAPPSFWYLCIYCGCEMVRGELLCPVLDVDGAFKDFHERIAIISDKDGYDGIRAEPEMPWTPTGDAEMDIPVKRKQSGA